MKDGFLVSAGKYRFTYLKETALQFRYLLPMLIAHSHLPVREHEDVSYSHQR